MSRVIRLFDDASMSEQRAAIPVHTPVVPLQDEVDTLVDSKSSSASPEELTAVAEAEAAAILARAQEEADRIVEAARSEAQSALEAARQQGQAEGFEAGMQKAQAEAEQFLAEQAEIATRAVQASNELRSRLLRDLQPPLVDVSMTAVQQLLQRELAVDKADIDAIVTGILAGITECTKVEVRVHPSDYAPATEAHAGWQSLKFGGWEVAVVPDPAVTPGGCEIRYDGGRADGTVETKLELLRGTLAEWLERGVSGYVATNGQ